MVVDFLFDIGLPNLNTDPIPYYFSFAEYICVDSNDGELAVSYLSK